MWMDETHLIFLEDPGILQQLTRLKTGIVLLQGPSQCGKTRLLQQLHTSDPRPILPISVEHILDAFPHLLFNTQALDTLSAELDHKIVCFEDIDLIASYPPAARMMPCWLNKLAQHALIILTGIDCTRLIPDLLTQIQVPFHRFFHTTPFAFGRRLAETRLWYDMPHAFVAAALGMTRSQYRQVEHGNLMCSSEMLSLYCNHFDIAPGDIICPDHTLNTARARKLVSIRKQNQLSQLDAAARLSLPYKKYARMERGQIYISPELIEGFSQSIAKNKE